MSEESEQVTESAQSEQPAAPALRVVRGDPTPEELAALVAVLGAMGGDEAPAPRPASVWAAPARRHREPHRHGAGGWRASSLPR